MGGRFNPPGEFGALYVSHDAATTRAELERRARRAGIEPEDLMPRSLVVVRLGLNRVLDLTDPEERAAVGLDESTVTDDDHGDVRQ